MPEICNQDTYTKPTSFPSHSDHVDPLSSPALPGFFER